MMRPMDSKRLSDQPAFPCSGTEGVNPESLGMTLRQYYAGLAMRGLLAADDADAKSAAIIATQATECADALIAALAKE